VGECTTAPVIAGLGAGVAFLLVLTYTIGVLAERVVTTPVVRLEQALATTETDLEKRPPEIVAPYKPKEGEGLHA